MKKFFLILLILSACPSWASDKMCADTTGGVLGTHSPYHIMVPVSYAVDSETGCVTIETTEAEQVHVQISGQQCGLVLDAWFFGTTSIILYKEDLYEIRFVLHSGKTYVDYFYV